MKSLLSREEVGTHRCFGEQQQCPLQAALGCGGVSAEPRTEYVLGSPCWKLSDITLCFLIVNV